VSSIELANAALMRQYYEEVFNRRNLAFMREHLHEDVVGHGPGIDDVVTGAEQVAAFSAYDRHDLYEKQLGGWRP